MNRVRKFLALPYQTQILLVASGLLFVGFSVSVRVGSLEASERLSRQLAGLGLARWSIEQTDRALSAIDSMRPGSGGCLPAALVGLAVTDVEDLELRLGVRQRDGSVEAHAWLESPGGMVVNSGANPAEFEVLS